MKPLSKEQELSLYNTSKRMLVESRGGLIAGGLEYLGKKIAGMTPKQKAARQATAQRTAKTKQTTQDYIDNVLGRTNPHTPGSRDYFEVERLKKIAEQGRGAELLGLRQGPKGDLNPLGIGAAAAGGAAVGSSESGESFLGDVFGDITKASRGAEKGIIGVPYITRTISNIATDPAEMAGLPQRFKRRGS